MFLDFKVYFSSSIAVLAQARHGHTRQAEVSGRQHPKKKNAQGNPTCLRAMAMEMLHIKWFFPIAAGWVPDHDVALQCSMCF
jgi:hypothetical protein